MIRITAMRQTTGEVELRLEGWIEGDDASVLMEEGESHLRHAPQLILDLEGVRSIDEAGISLLRRWSLKRVLLRGLSPYIRAVLQAGGVSLEAM